MYNNHLRTFLIIVGSILLLTIMVKIMAKIINILLTSYFFLLKGIG
ncbi:MAG: hypothetical protein QMD92_05670 [bacterium]|nr:hypothetical protein [bacterium]